VETFCWEGFSCGGILREAFSCGGSFGLRDFAAQPLKRLNWPGRLAGISEGAKGQIKP
jgi:hypothetical protein